ncbi:MAG: LCP family protein [bacterium]
MRTRKKASSLKKWIMGLGLLLLLIMGVGLWFFYFKTNKINQLVREGRTINILLIGIDNTGSKGLTDCLVLVSLEPGTRQVGIISIPRDTRVKINYRRRNHYDKINHVYARGGIDMLLSVTEDIFKSGGLPGFTIPFYVLLDYQGFVNVVDLLGGVEIFIDQEMHYIDRAGDLYIRIPRGLQKLDGEKTLQFVRFRSTPGGDLDRIKKREEVINLLAREIKANLSSPAMIKEIYRHIKANLGLAEMLSLASHVRHLSPEKNIAFFEIPGQGQNINGINYWQIDGIEFQKMVAKLKEHLAKTNESPLPSPEKVITVRILNGCRKGGLAAEVRDRLRREPKIDVVETGNAGRFDYQDTVIMDQAGNRDNAVYISKFLGQGKVIQKVDPKALVDVTIILGEDFINN